MSSSQTESGVMTASVVWAAATGRGHRPSNQDRFGVGLGSAGTLLVVCDGLGGHRAGEVAARFAVDRLLTSVRRGARPSELPARVERLSGEIASLGRKRPDWEGLGTTVAVVQVEGRRALWLTAGDSRIYLQRRGFVQLLAEPHELGRILLREGVLSEEELARSPVRGRLTSYLGLEAPELARGEIHLENGDRLVLASDGVLESGEDRVIRALAGDDLEDIARELVHGVATQDNATTIVAAINLVEAPCSVS